jgi:hypothetical protein
LALDPNFLQSSASIICAFAQTLLEILSNLNSVAYEAEVINKNLVSTLAKRTDTAKVKKTSPKTQQV